MSKLRIRSLFIESLIKLKLPIILAVSLYCLFYILRYQQGGWDIKIDLFQAQRQFLDQKISQILPSPQSNLLSGILLGIKKDLPAEFKLALRDTSTLHIVVVSGQNLTMLAGLFLNLAPILRRKLAICLSLLAVIFYTLLTGAEVPVLRAAVMFGMASLAQWVGREKDSWWILVVTASFMLLINPLWIKDLSFQLSFLATFGVVVVAGVLVKYLQWLPLLGQDLAVTLGAQAMVLPIIAQSFHQISMVGVMTNLLVLWTIPLIMILGLGALILGEVFTWVLWPLLTYFVYIVQYFAALPFAWEYVGEVPWIVWIGYYLILSGVLLAIYKFDI